MDHPNRLYIWWVWQHVTVALYTPASLPSPIVLSSSFVYLALKVKPLIIIFSCHVVFHLKTQVFHSTYAYFALMPENCRVWRLASQAQRHGLVLLLHGHGCFQYFCVQSISAWDENRTGGFCIHTWSFGWSWDSGQLCCRSPVDSGKFFYLPITSLLQWKQQKIQLRELGLEKKTKFSLQRILLATVQGI